MIPLNLRITGFLSYHETVELDFSTFELACISGQNGAGKSSLLDAFTWTLFGKARASQNEAIINLQSKAAEVALTFEYEGSIFRVIRALQRGRSTMLEFQIANDRPQTTDNGQRSMVYGLNWKPLTEKSTRETQARIEQTLRLDYETFINASFFLQGNADQFTQQNAGKRKDVLSNILGLEVWEQYKERTAERRKLIEREVDEIEGRVAEIDAELSEEDARKTRLAELEKLLKQMSVTRAAQEAALDLIKRNAASLDEQRKLVDTLSASLERTRSLLSGLQARLAAKETERAAYADLVGRANEIETEYKALQKSRKELEGWEKIAAQFHEHQKERAPLLEGIAGEKARLEQERASLSEQSSVISDQLSGVSELEQKIEAAKHSLTEAEARIKERLDLEAQRNASREKQAEMKAENDALKVDMNLLKERIETLKAAEGAACPLCGQALSKEHRKSTLKQLEEEGGSKGDLYRANQAKSAEISKQITNYELRITELAGAENKRIKHSNSISQLTERIETMQSLSKKWDSTGRKRLSELTKLLENKKYAVEAQKQLTKLDKELAKLGYDTAANDEARRKENSLRRAEDSFRELASAREVSRQIESEIANLNEERSKRQEEIAEQEAAFNKAAESLKDAQAHAPNLEEAERQLYRLREEENNARAEMGAARQKVDVLGTQRARKAKLSEEREEFQRQIAHHKTLERAFGKDGVPALLIEQSLPQIETKANDLLDRLSNGQMSVRFVTQEVYKDKKRDDLKETLDIQISDAAGVRDYEMYSGGEAFRINFAIRLALSEVLAQRKGARLQTLVIDEGFGSQDVQGRQRLIEAINLVKKDFAKILVITHLDELKDAFPTRIEVEKTEHGSMVRVI
jgi:exonuclease SbcC